jgi:hypothetical protein
MEIEKAKSLDIARLLAFWGLMSGNKSRTFLRDLRTRKPLQIKGFRVSYFTEQSRLLSREKFPNLGGIS